MTLKHKFKIIIFNTLIILFLLNTLYSAFFFEKSYQNVTITSQVRISSNAKAWFVYKNKNSEERFFSEIKIVDKNKTQRLSLNIESETELDYVGLFWNGPKESTIIIESYSCILDQDTILKAQNSNAIKYINSESILTNHSNTFSVTSTLSERNWIMLNNTDIINEKRDVKHHKPIPLLYNIVLLFILITFQLIRRDIKPIEISIFSLSDIRVKILRVWVFILPFWTIVSHTLLAISAVLSLIQFREKEKRATLINELKYFTPFTVFYLIVTISTFFSSTNDDFLKTIIDNVYFLLMPLVFLNINKKHLLSMLKWFEYGMICYFILLAIYISNQYYLVNPEVPIFNFIETTTEIFWHTSYLSALILIVLIKKLNRAVIINWQLIVFFIIALSYIYIVKARLPFVLGLVLVLLKFLESLKTKKGKMLYGFGIILIAFSLLLHFLFKPFNATQINNSSTSEIISLDARLTLWEAAIETSFDNLLFGVGSENTVPALAEKIPEGSNVKLRNFNAHNQFLETLLSYGAVSLISFLFLFYSGLKKRNIMTNTFIFVCISLFMVESYLQRQAGLIFFSFWVVFFINYALKKDESSN